MIDVQYEYRAGIGTDIHRLVAGRDLMLGGIQVPYPLGLLGHSDGDVVIHAMIDALLGAAGLGDIGTHFSDKDERWKNLDSKELLLIVRTKLEKEGWDIVNVDVVIHVEEPRMEPHKGQIKRCLSGFLGMDFQCMNIKAKTNEGMGPVGEGKAIASTATTLLKRRVKRSLR